MRLIGTIIKGILRTIARVLRHRFGWTTLGAILIFLWLSGVPLIRLTYSAFVLPLRSAQYCLSIHRNDAIRLDRITRLSPSNGTVKRFLERLALWTVLRSLRARGLSLEKQAIALAIVRQESAFRFYVKNPDSTACGLFQLISASGARHDLPWWRCMDPVANARAGTAFFRALMPPAPDDLPAAVRCAYLRHYSGPASSCAKDPRGIWKRAGKRLTGRTMVFLKALRQIEEEERRRGFIARADLLPARINPGLADGVCSRAIGQLLLLLEQGVNLGAGALVGVAAFPLHAHAQRPHPI